MLRRRRPLARWAGSYSCKFLDSFHLRRRNSNPPLTAWPPLEVLYRGGLTTNHERSAVRLPQPVVETRHGDTEAASSFPSRKVRSHCDAADLTDEEQELRIRSYPTAGLSQDRRIVRQMGKRKQNVPPRFGPRIA